MSTLELKKFDSNYRSANFEKFAFVIVPIQLDFRYINNETQIFAANLVKYLDFLDKLSANLQDLPMQNSRYSLQSRNSFEGTEFETDSMFSEDAYQNHTKRRSENQSKASGYFSSFPV